MHEGQICPRVSGQGRGVNAADPSGAEQTETQHKALLRFAYRDASGRYPATGERRTDFRATPGSARAAGSGAVRRAISISASLMSLATELPGPAAAAAARLPPSARSDQISGPFRRTRL